MQSLQSLWREEKSLQPLWGEKPVQSLCGKKSMQPMCGEKPVQSVWVEKPLFHQLRLIAYKKPRTGICRSFFFRLLPGRHFQLTIEI